MSVTLMNSDELTGHAVNTKNRTTNGAAMPHAAMLRRRRRGEERRTRGTAWSAVPGARTPDPEVRVVDMTSEPRADRLGLLLDRLRGLRGVHAGLADLLQLGVD